MFEGDIMINTKDGIFVDQKALTLNACEKAMRACLEKAREHGVNVAVAVLDSGGNLLHLSRMDGTHYGTSEVAIAKARCAIMHRVPTKHFSDLYAGGLTSLPALPGVLPFEGGVPISVGGSIVGSIGTSGATPDVDGIISQSGVSVLSS
jgi:uncharacterized protein GlcG (DUF336 family)